MSTRKASGLPLVAGNQLELPNVNMGTTGKSGSTKGSLKYDGDKPQMDLVPLSSAYAVAQVLTFGAKKYSANGWKDVPDARTRYQAAMLRHMTQVQEGEEFDEDSGLPHADHIACNAMFLSWFRRNPTRGLSEEITKVNEGPFAEAEEAVTHLHRGKTL